MARRRGSILHGEISILDSVITIGDSGDRRDGAHYVELLLPERAFRRHASRDEW